jgi:hypothetical protein
MRFRNSLSNPEKFAEKIEELKDKEICSFHLRRINLVIHDLYNTKKNTRIIEEFTLG